MTTLAVPQGDLHLAVIAAAYPLALAAAARSTWSPCGLSMLSSITPLGEAGRGRRFRPTATWFVAGATLGGATVGAIAAGLSAAVGALGPSAILLAALAALLLVLGAAGDLGLLGYRIPLLRRQVNERWLDHYRAWVYGGGFGWQIGTGVTTYVMTTAVFVTLAVAVLSASPAIAMSIGMVFGLSRGLAVLLGARITTPEALMRVHRGFDHFRRPVWLGVVITQAALGLALATVVWPPALALGGVGVVAVVWVLTRSPLRRLATPG
ncbi:MAG: hypothetical protein J2O47_09900 [Acidimicrobiaceae bacterium]|nr:hypothetical protein [Acidimicrobiaceae bacterium]